MLLPLTQSGSLALRGTSRRRRLGASAGSAAPASTPVPAERVHALGAAADKSRCSARPPCIVPAPRANSARDVRRPGPTPCTSAMSRHRVRRSRHRIVGRRCGWRVTRAGRTNTEAKPERRRGQKVCTRIAVSMLLTADHMELEPRRTQESYLLQPIPTTVRSEGCVAAPHAAAGCLPTSRRHSALRAQGPTRHSA